jgi:hypothetical protein
MSPSVSPSVLPWPRAKRAAADNRTAMIRPLFEHRMQLAGNETRLLEFSGELELAAA